MVDVIGTTKGRGFAGTIKRHGFSRGPETHGSMNVRAPGSIASRRIGKLPKGKRMAGHYGVERKTTKNLRVAADRRASASSCSSRAPCPDRTRASCRSATPRRPRKAAGLSQAGSRCP